MAQETLPTSSPGPKGGHGAVMFETQRLIVRRYRPEDASHSSKAANYPAIAAQLRNRFPSPYTLENAVSFIATVTKNEGTDIPLDVAVELKPEAQEDIGDSGEKGSESKTPRFIGGFGMVPGRDINYRTWEVGYWLTEPVWGKGLGTELVQGAVPWMFETWPQLHRIEAKAYGGNIGSQTVLLKSGLVKEGVKRQSCEKHGVLMDEVEFGLLRSDWEQWENGKPPKELRDGKV